MRTMIPPPNPPPNPPHSKLLDQLRAHCHAAVDHMITTRLGSVPDDVIRKYDNALVTLLRALPADVQPFSWGDTIPCPAPCDEVAS